MKCPFCLQNKTEVFNSRATAYSSRIWRRRKCLNCHNSFTTYESVDINFIKIRLKDGKLVPYSRARLYSNLIKVLDRDKLSDSVDSLTDTIEIKLIELKKTELSSAEIVKIVLTTLKHFNTKAFVRYLTEQTDLINDADLLKQLKSY